MRLSLSTLPLTLACLMALGAWTLALWGSPTGALAAGAALNAALACWPLQSRRLTHTLSVIALFVALALTWLWGRAWSPDRDKEVAGVPVSSAL